jgi:hypothetical protein
MATLKSVGKSTSQARLTGETFAVKAQALSDAEPTKPILCITYSHKLKRDDFDRLHDRLSQLKSDGWFVLIVDDMSESKVHAFMPKGGGIDAIDMDLLQQWIVEHQSGAIKDVVRMCNDLKAVVAKGHHGGEFIVNYIDSIIESALQRAIGNSA